MKKMYVGILAGGNGSRLWPLSNAQTPKQLLPFIHESSLLEQTLQRIEKLALPKEQLFIITHKEQAPAIKQAVGNRVETIVTEPCCRNTAPAILLGCHYVAEQDPEALVIFLPADHFIPNDSLWLETMEQLIHYAQTTDHLLLIGLKPTTPATGYGYIQTTTAEQEPLPIIAFHEKPSQAVAQEYLQHSNMYWNIGMFCGPVSTFFEEFKLHTPELYVCMQQYLSHKLAYHDLSNISIDYAVMQKTKRAQLIPAIFPWYDVGNVAMFLALQKHFNQLDESVISIGGNNNLVSTKKKIVACVGVSNLCVIETDDALLIVSQDQAELVKEVTSHLKDHTP